VVFLYHVTRVENIPLLRRAGIRTGMPPAEAKLAGVPEEEWDVLEISDEERAREIFDGYLREAAPVGMPRHDQAVFFWSDPDKARGIADAVTRQSPWEYEVVVVDADRIPCGCYEAPYMKAESLFSNVKCHVREFENIESIGPETDEDERLVTEAQDIARDYYASMRPFTGVPDAEMEVACGCDIPPEAIVGQLSTRGVMYEGTTYGRKQSEKK